MKIHCPSLIAAAALCLSPLAALAQASAPPAPGPASAPVAAKTGPRLLTPAESRDRATAAGDLRPERPVTPQISIPLGRKPPATASPAARPGDSKPDTGVDDAAARCEALAGEQVRAKCRDKVARDARARAAR